MKGDKECEDHHCEYLNQCKWKPEECQGKPWGINVTDGCKTKVRELASNLFPVLMKETTQGWQNWFVVRLLVLVNEFNTWSATVELTKKREATEN